MSEVETRILGQVRTDHNEFPPELNEDNELLIVQGAPALLEMTRRGSGYSVIATDAVAAVVVRPSTVAALTLWNGERPGGKCYIVDRIFSHCLVAGGEEGRACLWACLHPAGTAEPGDADITAAATNLVGPYGKTYNGRAKVDVGDTVVDNGWYPWGYSVKLPNTALPGAVISVDVAGRLIIPPTGAISLQVVSSKVDETFCSGLTWYEEQITLG